MRVLTVYRRLCRRRRRGLPIRWKLDSEKLEALLKNTHRRACRRQTHSSCMTRSACRWTSCRTPLVIRASSSIGQASIVRWRSRELAHALRGRARRSRRRTRRIRNCRRRSSKDTGRRARTNCEVLAIIRNGQGVQELKPGEEGEVILDHTPFYAEAGGQVGDRGWFYSDDHNTVVADVKGCYYPIQGVRAHQVVMKSGSTSPLLAQNAREKRVPSGWGSC